MAIYNLPEELRFRLSTHCSEYHVEWHGNVKVKRVIIAHADHEEHEDEVEVVLESDTRSLPAQLVSADKAFQRDECELGEGDEVAGTWIMSGEKEGSIRNGSKWANKNNSTAYLINSSRKTTLLQQPTNTPTTAQRARTLRAISSG